MKLIHPNQIIRTALLLVALSGSCILTYSQSAESVNIQEKTAQTVYELRIYYPHEGKLDEILSRFRNHTTGLFEKHGFSNVGYWVTRPDESPSFATRITGKKEGKQALLYMVSFPNMVARNKAWDAFINDPEWIEVYEASRINGPLVWEIDQIFMNPTDFSELK